MSQSGFEGVEKRLELEFSYVPNARMSSSLRSIPRDQIDHLLDLAQCKVLSVSRSDACDAYLLSESSLFVYKTRIILKTCGTTVPIKAIPDLLVLAEALELTPETLYFTRKNFSFPHQQVYPHTSFEDEVSVITSLFPGSAKHSSYAFAPDGESWVMHVVDFREDETVPSASPAVFEMMMFGLHKNAMRYYFQDDQFVSAKQQTLDSGINCIQPESKIDEFSFSPCGYSMNALIGSGHTTIHVTPEDHCSYVSFETTSFPSDPTELSALISRVLTVFQPSRFTLVCRNAPHSPLPNLSVNHLESCLGPDCAWAGDDASVGIGHRVQVASVGLSLTRPEEPSPLLNVDNLYSSHVTVAVDSDGILAA